MIIIFYVPFQVAVKRHNHTPKEFQKSKSVEYSLKGVRICKAVFCGTLGISKSRVTYVLNNKMKSGIVSPDKRGKRSPANKTPTEINVAINLFLDKFPKFKSHNSKSSKIHFSPELTYKKLHSLFLEAHPKIQCSLFVFMKQFKKFNISIQ